MKTWEALKLLEEGQKLRRSRWDKESYIILDKVSKELVHSNGNGYSLGVQISKDDWELYIEDTRKDIPFKTKDVVDAILQLNCTGIDCKECPLKIKVYPVGNHDDSDSLCKYLHKWRSEVRKEFKTE